MKKLIYQSFVLILSFVLVYTWQQTALSLYTIPAIGLLIFFYLAFSYKRRGKGFLTIGDSPWSIFALITVILLLIFSTDNLNSPIFFLLYFLGFGIAFVFEPLAIFVFVLGTFLVFLPEALKNDVTGNFMRLGSLVLISPLAYFFGREFRQNDEISEDMEKMTERVKDAGTTIAQDVAVVLKNQQGKLDKESTEKLKEINEEAKDLKAEGT